jgi:hypothetical protein
MIITMGFGSNLVITMGFGRTSLLYVSKIVKFDTEIMRKVLLQCDFKQISNQ